MELRQPCKIGALFFGVTFEMAHVARSCDRVAKPLLAAEQQRYQVSQSNTAVTRYVTQSGGNYRRCVLCGFMKQYVYIYTKMAIDSNDVDPVFRFLGNGQSSPVKVISPPFLSLSLSLANPRSVFVVSFPIFRPECDHA